jgi:N-formylmaleamate deformylase
MRPALLCLPLFLALLFGCTSAALAVAPPRSHPAFTVRVVGHGRPLILIPGLTCPGAVWDETVARYRAHYQCHVISLAGFAGVPAQSPVPEHLLQATRDQLLDYIHAQKLHRPTVIGHSLGGFLALWMSIAEPAAMGPLVIVDSVPFLPAGQLATATTESVRPFAEATRQRLRTASAMSLAGQRQMVAPMITDTARITQAARWGQASDRPTVGQVLYEMYTTDLRPEAGRIQQPALVLGAWATYAPVGQTKAQVQQTFDEQYKLLKGYRLALSESGKHFLMWDDPQWFFAQVDAFLQQNAGACGGSGSSFDQLGCPPSQGLFHFAFP